METAHSQSSADKALAVLIDRIVALTRKNRIRPDWRGQWFANNKLNTLRRLYEMQGYGTARLFQIGQIEKRDPRGKPDSETVKNQILLEILDAIEKTVSINHLDLRIGAYLIGRLNAVISETEENNKSK